MSAILLATGDALLVLLGRYRWRRAAYNGQ
jgi:hypothetical protein